MPFRPPLKSPPSRRPAVPPSPSRPPGDCAVAQYWRALRDVTDPEFPISIVDLGLVYDVRASGGVLEIDLTFTATGCPCMDFIRDDLSDRLLQEPGVEAVRIHEVWDPPWTPARISPEGRVVLRRHGVGT